MLLLPRLDADALVHEGALQVPAGASFPTRGSSRRTAAAASASRSSSSPTPASSTTSRYFDVFAEYAKASPERHPHPHHGRQPRARGGDAAPAADALVPQHLVLGLHATKAAGRKPRSARDGRRRRSRPSTPRSGRIRLDVEPARTARRPSCCSPRTRRTPSGCSARRTPAPYVKDAFHDYVVARPTRRREPGRLGTKAAAHYRLDDSRRRGEVDAAAAPDAPRTRRRRAVRPRLRRDLRRAHRARPTSSTPRASPPTLDAEERARRPAGLRRAALEQAVLPLRRRGLARRRSRRSRRRPPARKRGRNHDWPHLFNRDVISMPDKWEYPVVRRLGPGVPHDPVRARSIRDFAKEQLVLFLREWYMHPNGQIPAYEFAFSRREPAGARLGLLARLQDDRRRAASATACSWRACFQKLLLNFTWWVNRKDVDGQATSSPAASSGSTTSASSTARSRCPTGGHLEQADGTAWMAFYCADHALDGARAGAATIPPTRTSPPSSSSTSSPSPTP